MIGAKHVRRPLAVAALLALLTAGAASAPQSTIAYFTDSPTVSSTVDGLEAAPAFTCDQGITLVTRAPLIYYPLSDPAGSTAAVDASGNGFTGIAGGTPVTGYDFGQPQPCSRDGDTGVRFGGTNGTIATPDVSGVAGTAGARWNTFTVSLWFRGDSSLFRGGLIGMNSQPDGEGVAQDRRIYVAAGGRLRFGVFDAATESVQTIVTPPPESPGSNDYRLPEWHMVTASLSSAGLKLYIDGDLVPNPLTEQGLPASSVVSATQRSPDYWVIGTTKASAAWIGGVGAASTYWVGEIAKVGIWDVALTDQEIRDLYRSALPLIP